MREWEQMQNSDHLHMVGMEELMDHTFPVKEPVIEGLLYKGACLRLQKHPAKAATNGYGAGSVCTTEEIPVSAIGE